MSLPYYKRFPRDFLEGTIGLSFEEKGAYAIVLDLIYMRDGGLPDDPRYIAGQLGCSVRMWSKIKLSLVEKGKLSIHNGIISNFRADYLLEETRKYQDKQAENRTNSNKNNDVKKPSNNHSRDYKEPESEPIKKERKRPSYPEDFLACWKAFPHFDGRSAQNKSYDQFKLLTDDEREGLLSAIARMASSISKEDARFVPAMERWLRDGKHRHFMDGSGQPEALDDERWQWRIEKGKASGWRTEWGEPPDNDNTKCPKHLRSAWKTG